MEYILIALVVYLLVTAYLLGSFQEGIRQDQGFINFPQFISCMGLAILWPVSLIWYGYARISNK